MLSVLTPGLLPASFLLERTKDSDTKKPPDSGPSGGFFVAVELSAEGYPNHANDAGDSPGLPHHDQGCKASGDGDSGDNDRRGIGGVVLDDARSLHSPSILHRLDRRLAAGRRRGAC